MSIDKTQVIEEILEPLLTNSMTGGGRDYDTHNLFETATQSIQSLISDITTEAELRGEIKGRTTIFELLKSTGTITEADVLAQPLNKQEGKK